MEPKLIFFLAFAAVALIMNAAILFAAYKMFAGMTKKASDAMQEFQSSKGTREMLVTLQSASEQAVKVTTVAREQIVGLAPAVERMQTAYTEGLSRADVRLKIVSKAVHFAAEQTEAAVKWPVRHVIATASGLGAIIDFIRGSESGSDARSRRTR